VKLSTRLFRNTAANYVGRFTAFAVAFFLMPFVINSLGDTDYGVWTLVLSVSGYLALLDLGLAQALAKYTAEYAARRDETTVRQMASSLFFAFGVVGLAAFAGLFWFSFHFADFFDVPAAGAQAAQAAVITMGLNFAIGLPLSVYNALLVGYQRYDLLNLSVTLGWLANAGLTLLALTLGWSLVGLAAVACTVTMTRALVQRWALRQWVAPFRIRRSEVRGPLLRLLLSFSAYMLVMMVCRRVEGSTGPIIVGRLVGLEEVTTYAVGVKVSTLLRHFAFPVTVSLFPAFSELDALAERRGLRALLTQGLRISALVGMPVAGMAIVLIRPIISLWVGPQHLASAGIAVVMLLKVLVDQQLLAASSLLHGMARLKLYTALHIGALFASLGVGLAFAPRWGAMAVAVGSLLAWGLALAVTVPHAARIAGLDLAGLVKKALLKPLVPTLLTCAALHLLCRWHTPATWAQLLLYGSVVGLLYLPVVWLYSLDKEERKAILRWAREILAQRGLTAAARDGGLEEVR
jgi:O-antigen/teichoic acid export membrane protein